MKFSTLGRHIREGSKSLLRNGWMSFASISSISISLFILGLFLLLTLNINYFSKQIEEQVEIRVFLDVNITTELRGSIESSLRSLPEAAKVTFVSKEEGLQLMRERMGEPGKGYLEGMDGDNNPLNDSFTVEAKDPRQVEQLADRINTLNDGKVTKPIIRVNYGKDTVENLFKVTDVIKLVGLIMVACLALTAMFLISNTIKLTILARNREIKIMKLVGATNSFIRWPFFIEGALLGLCGSIIPVAVLIYGYWALLNNTGLDASVMMVSFMPFVQVSYPLGGLLLSIGIVIGVWGSTISVRKFLKV